MEEEVKVYDMRLDTAQYETLVGHMERIQSQNVAMIDGVSHLTVFVALLCVLEMYRILSRARKRGVKNVR